MSELHINYLEGIDCGYIRFICNVSNLSLLEQWKDTKTAAIVDFMAKECRKYRNFEEERFAIAKEWLTNMNIMNFINETGQQIFRNSMGTTEELCDYTQKIKDDVNKLANLLEVNINSTQPLKYS